jgi:hypothetical protein
MAGLVPAIHVLNRHDRQDVDARDARGHDETMMDPCCYAASTRRNPFHIAVATPEVRTGSSLVS